jgi:DNA-binding MarR family transcriptional regulator
METTGSEPTNSVYLCKITDVTDYATSRALLADVERVVVASVAVTARALNDANPELTLSQWRVMVLVDRPGGMAVGALANSLDAKIAAVSRLVGRLRERGLVQARRSDQDARVVLVSLTAKGRALRRRIVDRRRAVLASLLADTGTTRGMLPAVTRLAQVLEAAEE